MGTGNPENGWHPYPRPWSARQKYGRRPVSRILSRTAIPLGGALLRALLSDLPAGLARRAGAPLQLAPQHSRLFGLAPCGVYPAMRFTTHAVRSYRTVSPLPAPLQTRAVYFLWHLPSRSLDAPVPDVIRHTALRSSDFPLPAHLAAHRQRPSSRLPVCMVAHPEDAMRTVGANQLYRPAYGLASAQESI